MSERVLILSGSPRKRGNTDRMADGFARGAAEAGQAPDESYMKPMIEDFRRYIGCFKGSRKGGYAFAYGVDRPDDVEGTPALRQAYDMGRGL